MRPARIDFSASPPRSLDFGDVYHPQAGAQAQAQHVFLSGNDLPSRWQGRARFAVLETGFGLGHNFLATWQAWRLDPQRCERLDFVSVEAYPAQREDLARAHGLEDLGAHACDGSLAPPAAPSAEGAGTEPPRPLVQSLIAQWPPLVAGLHLRQFEQGRVRLLLGFGEARQLLPRLIGRIDAFFLDGFAPTLNPALWDERLLKCLGRLAAPDATAATWSVARSVRDGLSTAGFVVNKAPGLGPKREMTLARYAPRSPAKAPPGRPPGPWPGERRAVIVGAGLAGAGVAQALARLGWRCTVVDERAAPAEGASGNPAGLFHSVVHHTDGIYARLHRAAALLAHGVYAPLVASGEVAGSVDGMLLRREATQGRQGTSSPASQRGLADAVSDAPPGTLDIPYFSQVVSAEQARLRVGAWRDGLALHLAQAGWIDPAGLVRHWLSLPGVEFIGNRTVHHIDPPRTRGAPGAVRDVRGQVIAEAPVIVMAQGPGVRRWIDEGLIESPPLSTVRGQLTWFDHDGALRQPVSGEGYALTLPDGRMLCGATSHADDATSDGALALRDEDHCWNIERMRKLTGLPGPEQPNALGGRAHWRVNASDRLPLIGPVATPATPGERRDQPRLVGRVPGLFVAAAFGSRGLVWAPLAGELIAAWLEGTPVPLEADLVDAIDPARWPVRRHRRPINAPAV